MRTLRLATLVLLGLAAPLPTALAQVAFTHPREFILDTPCDAHTSFKKGSDPVALPQGARLKALGENRSPGATHAFVEVGGERKWLELRCGHYTAGDAPGEPPIQPSQGRAACLPFFDEVENPVKVKVGGTVDITPPPPLLSPFDLAVNAACGAPGTRVSERAFATLMQSHPEVLERLMAFTGGRVFADRPVRTSQAEYLRDLTQAWFAVGAFDHIFCGEPGESIGGMHFRGRYLQLQESGDACRMANFHQNEVVPGVIYTMGVEMRDGRGGTSRHAIKGYGMTLSAEELLKAATRALAENPAKGSESSACLLPVADDGATFKAVFVRRAKGIRTFYPDATPSPGDPSCAAPVVLGRRD